MDTGAETYCRQLCEKNDTTWMPFKMTFAMQAAGDLRLEESAGADDPTQRALASVEQTVVRIAAESNELQKQTRHEISQLKERVQEHLSSLSAQQKQLNSLAAQIASVRVPDSEQDVRDPQCDTAPENPREA